jgi:hypothetical protein
LAGDETYRLLLFHINTKWKGEKIMADKSITGSDLLRHHIKAAAHELLQFIKERGKKSFRGYVSSEAAWEFINNNWGLDGCGSFGELLYHPLAEVLYAEGLIEIKSGDAGYEYFYDDVPSNWYCKAK